MRSVKYKNIMKNMDVTPELSSDLIERAVVGEPEAVEKILHIYDKYINAIVSYEVKDAYGNIIRRIDEDMKIQIQMKLIESIQTKWRNLIK